MIRHFGSTIIRCIADRDTPFRAGFNIDMVETNASLADDTAPLHMRYSFPCDRISATTVNEGIAPGKLLRRRETLLEGSPNDDIGIGSSYCPFDIWGIFELRVDDKNAHIRSKLR
jgi:hypothetical protein